MQSIPLVVRVMISLCKPMRVYSSEVSRMDIFCTYYCKIQFWGRTIQTPFNTTL